MPQVMETLPWQPSPHEHRLEVTRRVARVEWSAAPRGEDKAVGIPYLRLLPLDGLSLGMPTEGGLHHQRQVNRTSRACGFSARPVGGAEYGLAAGGTRSLHWRSDLAGGPP
jgi:hypothetical protein